MSAPGAAADTGLGAGSSARPTRSRSRNPDGRMSLGQHVRELRNRLFVAAIAILGVGVAAFFLVTDHVWDALRQPLLDIAAERDRQILINYADVTSAFDLRMQIALTVGIVVAAPVWMYQIWAFIVPALSRREKRYGLSFLLSAVPLFFAGCFAGWLVLPHIVALMTSFAPAEDAAYITARSYLDLALKLLVAVGVAFVVPVVLVLLNFLGILRGSSILLGWRWAILGIMLFAALATPAADVVSMFLLAIPMLVLYFAAAGVAMLNDRVRDRRQKAILETGFEAGDAAGAAAPSTSRPGAEA